MSVFQDAGRMILEAVITGKLGIHADDVNVPSLVEEYVSAWGFMDLDEVPPEAFWRLVAEHRVPPVE